jgi:F0F1-type ATP synthase gamma subunit
MSDHYEYYLNNPYEAKVDYTIEDEYIEDKIEEAADNKDFVYDLLADQYVDFDVTTATLRAMFKSYCNRMNATKQSDKDDADKDLLIFTKSLMAAMYEAATEIIVERGE